MVLGRFGLLRLFGCGCLGRRNDSGQDKIPDEESRLLPESIPHDGLESSVVITVENGHPDGQPDAEIMKERMRERFNGIVRAKEGRMVSVTSYVPFNLYSGSRASSSMSRSMSRSRNPHANILSPISTVLPAQSDVVVQADAGGRSSSQVPPLRHGQPDLTHLNINVHSNNAPPHLPFNGRNNSNSDMSAIYAARRPSLAASETDTHPSSPLRPVGLNARLVGVGVGGGFTGARRGRPKTKFGGCGGSSSSLSLGGTSCEGEHSPRIPPPPPPQAPASSPVEESHVLASKIKSTAARAPSKNDSQQERTESERPCFAIMSTEKITIGWDD
ncbi:hypothetical protein E1B28_013166 [Marasmius oreades]|uniref:Uncharacterized protein n=1 Tax=Marasmius oreades TaxID=181124 RepID=A0A9P7RQ14_9AGAR|nr:uncharacterized protein E1B28_013166 [Marasmius oreades]KAG7087186.1 hypothetical protein E1B28_013166 [Marasmius oreades]